MSTELTQIPFEGDTLEAISQGNQIWVSIRRICEALGVDNMGQQVKLKKKPWATIEHISAVAKDGKIRNIFCIHLDSVPMWLAGMEAGRVKQEVRPKLERYQRKCAQVLKEAFIKPPPPPPFSNDPIELIIQQAQGLVAVATELRNQSHRISRVESTVDKLVETQGAAQQALITVERATEKPTQRTTRSKIVELVRAYAYTTFVDYRWVWNKLYRELLYRYHFDAKARARSRSSSPLHIIEEEGLLEPLFLIASELLWLPTKTTIESDTPASFSLME